MTKAKWVAFILSLLTPALTTRVSSQTYPNSNDPVFLSTPTQRSDHDLNLVVGVGAPGSLDEISLKLIKRTLTPTLSAQQFVQIGESATQNIQNGGNSFSSAGTSLVTKAMSSILGVAEEAGAISSSSSGSATTLTANIPQFFTYMEPPDQRCYVISDKCSFGGALIRGASASVSLNTSKSSTPSGTNLSTAAFAGISGTQNPVFNGFTFQENFHGRKNTGITQKDFQSAIDKVADAKKTDLLNAFQAIEKDFIGSDAYKKQLAACVKSLQQPDAVGDHIKQLLDNCVNSFADVAQGMSKINSQLTKYAQAEVAYDIARDAALTTLFYASTFSIEYSLTNNLNQPTQSTFKGVYGYQSKSGVLQTTANGSATLYNSLEGSSESRLRSAQGAVQLDYKPDTKSKLQEAWSAGYYFQYMVANGLINLPSTAFAPGTTISLPSNASVLLNTTGPISIGQGKVTLTIKGTNVSIPLAITGASRTDLIKANKVSGNFGISYDFSSLFANPKK
jgi:hypothetical protein